MLDISRASAVLTAAKDFAAASGLLANLEEQLQFLDGYGGPNKVTRCILYPDLAEHSFAFLMEIRGPDDRYRPWFGGALIFHGPHDGGGCGCAPTYAVAIEPAHGWLIHT